jgi:hypothetical protein
VPLATCDECEGTVSTEASTCPHCGAPQRKCPRCGSSRIENVDGLKGGENAVALLLLALMVVPGLAYYFDRTRLPYCQACHHRVPSGKR